MGVSVTPPAAVNLADNPKNRLYRATESGTYSANIPVGVYEVTRQATTNIIIGSTTIAPSTIMSLVFINEQQNSITFNSTVSSNAVPWAFVTYGYSGGGNTQRMHYFLNRYIATPNSNSSEYATSSDGITWITGTFNHGVRNVRNGAQIAEGPGPLFIQGLWTDTQAYVRTTTDFINWSVSQTGMTSVGFPAVAHGNGIWVVGGFPWEYTAGAIMISTNGFSWTNRVDLMSGHYFYTGHFAQGLFVFGSTAGTIVTSTNGITWTHRQARVGASHIRDIHYANNMWMLVGSQGNVSTSTDAITWTNANLGEPSIDLHNVLYSEVDNIWVITNSGTFMRISTDGTNWQAREVPNGVRGHAIAINDQGRYLYANSADATNFRAYRVGTLLTTVPTVPFQDTYIILEYKGKTKVLS